MINQTPFVDCNIQFPAWGMLVATICIIVIVFILVVLWLSIQWASNVKKESSIKSNKPKGLNTHSSSTLYETHNSKKEED